MSRMVVVLLLAVAVAVALAAVSGASGGNRRARTLVGTVGPGFTIRLTQNGKVVKTLKAGTYRLVVHDKAPVHAFSLDGPKGYAKDFTAVPFVGTKSFTLKLRVGAYKYYCPPHEPTMFGRFVVH